MLKIVNPATGNIIDELPTDSAPTVREKFEEAAEASQAWRQTPFEHRKQCLEKFATLLVAHEKECASILTEEVGKPITQSHNELKGMKGRLSFFLENTESLIASETVHKNSNTTEVLTYEPLGVVGNISAWNYPYFVASGVFAPALLTGNAVLYKPSEFSSLTGLKIAELLHSSGIPKPIFQTLIGTGECGQALCDLPLDGLYFTGSVATGKKIAANRKNKLAPLQLELGGKDPAYVAEDAQVETAAKSLADGAFYNNGQSCCSVERIYVHKNLFDPFIEIFLNEVKNFKVGDPTDPDTYIGPLTRPQQISVLEAQFADATAKGAKCLHGGSRLNQEGTYFTPTVLTRVNHDMNVMNEESFGPIIGIQRVEDDNQAIQLMNDTEYGLTAGVYTTDKVRALKMLAQLNAGSAYWNCCDRVSPRLPWAGWKNSGLGATLSKHGVYAFVKTKGLHLVSP